MHFGWVIVAACLVIGICGYGTYYCFTLFYSHLVAEFGWSRSAISGVMSLGLVAYGFFALPMGWCADRFGPRRTVIAGGLFFGIGTALAGTVTELWQLYALYGGLIAVGVGAVWAPLVSTVSRWFAERRGLALGIAVLGSGSGIFFVAPLAEFLIASSGWRMAYLWLGALSGGLIVIAALFLVRDPAARGLKPYGAPADHVLPVAETAPRGRMRDFAGTWMFWRMSLTFGLWWFAGAIVYVQIAPFLLEKGFASPVTALLVTVFGASNCLGRIGFGWLSDRIGSVRSYQLALISCALASAGFGAVDAFYPIAAIAVLLGFGVGGVSAQLTAVSVDLFGTAAAGAMMGTVLAIMGVLGAGGPLFSGAVYDAVQSYGPAFYAGAGVFLLALCVSIGLRKYRELENN